jgi:hypothetical protein
MERQIHNGTLRRYGCFDIKGGEIDREQLETSSNQPVQKTRLIVSHTVLNSPLESDCFQHLDHFRPILKAAILVCG